VQQAKGLFVSYDLFFMRTDNLKIIFQRKTKTQL
jgi:hypothetical protein